MEKWLMSSILPPQYQWNASKWGVYRKWMVSALVVRRRDPLFCHVAVFCLAYREPNLARHKHK